MKYKAEEAAVRMAIKKTLRSGNPEKGFPLLKKFIEKNPNYNEFVIESVGRHLPGDWGETCPEDAEINNADPSNSMSAYTSKDGA